MNPTIIIYLVGGSIVLGGVIIAIIGVVASRKNIVGERMQTLVGEREVSTTVNERIQASLQDYSTPLLKRTLIPGAKKVITFFGQLTPKNSIQATDHQLAIARYPMNMKAREFYGLRVILLFIGIGLAIFLNNYSERKDLLIVGMDALIILTFFLAPVAWLSAQVRKVQDDIRRGLPGALDMLSVCVSAGLGFDQSMQKITVYWESALCYEFRRVVQEMEVGITRAEALRNMANRTEVAELSSFVAIIIQAETLGMHISDVLHTQADQMRILRTFRAKEIANRLPAKMMIPLALLILPAMMAVILGPAIPGIIQAMSNF